MAASLYMLRWQFIRKLERTGRGLRSPTGLYILHNIRNRNVGAVATHSPLVYSKKYKSKAALFVLFDCQIYTESTITAHSTHHSLSMSSGDLAADGDHSATRDIVYGTLACILGAIAIVVAILQLVRRHRAILIHQGSFELE